MPNAPALPLDSSGPPSFERPRVLIVGGGAGGLELAVALARQGRVQVVLVDAERSHVWKPHLHEVAAGQLNPEKESVEYMALASRFGFKFVRGWVEGLDRENKRALVKAETRTGYDSPAQSIPYGHCVLAVGSSANDFGTPGVLQHAMRLDDLGSAQAFHAKLLNLAEMKERVGDSDPMRIAIVGGGATGVELAAELAEASKKLAFYGHEQIKKTPIEISILNAAPALLPGLPDRVASAAQSILEGRGVAIKNNAKVKAVLDGSIDYEDADGPKSAPCDIAVWAAGVKAPEWLKSLGLDANRINQLLVSPAMATSDPCVSAMGDCCSAAWAAKPGQTVPPRAQAAHQMADYLADTLADRIDGRAVPPFAYKDYGSLVSLGSHATAGTLMGALAEKSLFVEGKLAKFMYLALYHGHQFKIHGPVSAMGLFMGKSLQKRFDPKIKLH